jgi:hypothetical protein
MLEQVSNSVKFLAFYTASKQGKTGLTVTVDIYSPSGTQIVTAGSATALGGGLYSYTLTSNNSSEGEYAAIFKTTDSTVDAQHIPSLWVLGRAGVENLDAATSTRLASSAYEAPSNSDISAIKAKTDNLPSDPADQSLVEAAISGLTIPSVVQIRTEMDSNSAKLANLDATISSRSTLTTGDLPSVPSAASVASAVRTELTELSNLDASVSSRLAGSAYSAPSTPPTAADIASAVWAAADKTGYSLTSAERSAIATAVETSILNEADGQQILNAIVGAIGNSNVDQVALVAAIRADLERTGGKLINLDASVSSRLASADYNAPTSAPTAASVATAVWGAATKEITGGTVTTLTNAPSVPSAASIRAEIDSNSTQLAAIKAKTDLLPASPAATGDIPSANITAIKAKTDSINVDRINNTATLSQVGNLLAQANS